ncbi:hypothetical protein [Streptomyces sp. NPDC058644]|uniref:hypothetical protein n=1 Tax=unclassified Streptomyces TaxID=2593676 RepID=UPI00364D6DEE
MTEEPHVPRTHEEKLGAGEEVDLRPRAAEAGGGAATSARVDAAGGEHWGAAREVDASMLAKLLIGQGGSAPTGTHRTLWLAGARIVGTLDLTAAVLTRPLYLEDCYFAAETPLLFNDARAVRIQLPGCHARGFQGRAMHTQGDLCLGDGFTATGEVQLQGAHIHGTLDCDDGTFTNPGGKALDASRISVDGSLWFVKARLTGGVRLISAQIGGQVNCAKSSFDNSASEGGRNLALDAYGLDVKGSMFLCGGFTALGEVRLGRSRIGGDLDCSHGSFTQVDGSTPALNLYGTSVIGAMLCKERFTAVGEVRMIGARIGAELEFLDSTFTNEAKGGKALSAERLTVESTMKCSKGFRADGEVDLAGARIGGDLDLREGSFTNSAEDEKAIDAKRLTVLGTAKCSAGFSAVGEVDFTSAHIGELDCKGCSFTATAAGKCAITLLSAEVTRGVLFRPEHLYGVVDLRSAKVGRWDDSAKAWRGGHAIRLSGFTYNSIGSAADDEHMVTAKRLDWISRDAEGFVPQPYRQLADVYQREGSERDARKVQITAQWRRRNHPKTRADRKMLPFRTAWKGILRGTIGFGYQPWLILLPIAVLYSFGCYWFSRAYEHDDIVRARTLDPDVEFSGAIYTADLLIPGANLGERSRFLATEGTAVWAASYTLAGWALAAMLIAGLTGVFKRP